MDWHGAVSWRGAAGSTSEENHFSSLFDTNDCVDYFIAWLTGGDQPAWLISRAIHRSW